MSIHGLSDIKRHSNASKFWRWHTTHSASRETRLKARRDRLQLRDRPARHVEQRTLREHDSRRVRRVPELHERRRLLRVHGPPELDEPLRGIPRERDPRRLDVARERDLRSRGRRERARVIRPEDERDLGGVVRAQVGARGDVGEDGWEGECERVRRGRGRVGTYLGTGTARWGRRRRGAPARWSWRGR